MKRSSRPRAHQREATRRQLIEAGLRVIRAHGFAGATTAAIAKETGRAHGTVFVHFPTRDALITELVEEVGRVMSQRLADMPAETAGVADVLDAHLAALGAQEELFASLLRESTSLPLVARARVFALQSGIASRLRKAHAREVARGTARAMEPVTLANTWIALTSHYLMNRDLFAPGGSVIASHGGELKAQLLELLRP